MFPSIRLLPGLVLLLVGACVADLDEPASRMEALSTDCIVRGDADAFDLELALKYFKWDGVTHDSVSVAHVLNDVEDLRERLASASDVDEIDTLERRIGTGLYLVRYQAILLNASGKISKNKVKSHDPSSIALCPDAGCEAGADEDARFVHHAYRVFHYGRDATAAELSAALAALPDRSAADYDSTQDYRDELAAWVDATFTADACASEAILEPSYYYDRLAHVALHRGAGDPLYSIIQIGNTYVVVGTCESQMDVAYDRTFFSAEYLAPESDSYRYNLNPDATPSSCPTPL